MNRKNLRLSRCGIGWCWVGRTGLRGGAQRDFFTRSPRIARLFKLEARRLDSGKVVRV